jgi:16S rRNA (uracil1498-N3)-methyltransferase
MQCGRDTVPPVHAPLPLMAWLAARPRARTGWSLDPLAAQSLAASATRHAGLADADLLVGPESGLTPEEIALAGQAGLLPVSLGPRVLRTETAGLAALALLQGVLGDLA